ncbi:hypothetical protein BC830DRAFT_1095365 [Chytriomyces sp. MP71]|nr:hypothetical protein BC830DRAFT_1095365 [Chytriomyces sp. MP71]
MQYNGAAAGGESDEYWKAKLEQARFDNESLRAVIHSLTNRTAPDASPAAVYRPSSASPSPSPFPHHRAAAYQSPMRARVSQPDFRSMSTPVKAAWSPATGQLTTAERFMDKLRRFEEEDEEEEPDARVRVSQGHGTLLGRRVAAGLERGLERRVSVGSVMSGGSEENGGPVDYVALREEFDAQLRRLHERKASLTSELQRIPMASATSRRKKDVLDDELDQVEKAIGATRMGMRKAGLL